MVPLKLPVAYTLSEPSTASPRHSPSGAVPNPVLTQAAFPSLPIRATNAFLGPGLEYESVGNMVKLSMPDLMNDERLCFNKRHRSKNTTNTSQSESSESVDWQDLIPN